VEADAVRAAVVGDPVEPAPSWRATALKWVGGITAGVSLLLGIQQLVSWVGDVFERRREAATLVEMAREQSARNAYADAWASLDRASQVQPGTQVVPMMNRDCRRPTGWPRLNGLCLWPSPRAARRT